MSKKMKQYVTGLSIAIIIYAVVASWMTIRDIIMLPELIDTIILFILASATIFYAVRTSDIAEATEKQAKATKEQADASVKMAEEMRKQRLTASQPLIFPDFAQARFPDPGEIWYANSGNGPALKVKIAFAYSTTPDVVEREWIERTGPTYSKLSAENPKWTFIKAGDRFSYRPELAERSPRNIGVALVEYSDIYGRCFLAGWGYRCEKDNEECITLQPTEPIYPRIRDEEGENHD